MVLVGMRKCQQMQEILLKVKLEYVCQEVKDGITLFHGLALFHVRLNTVGFSR